MNSKYRNWSEWQNPDFVAKADQQPTRFSGGNDYQIRYKVDYQDGNGNGWELQRRGIPLDALR